MRMETLYFMKMLLHRPRPLAWTFTLLALVLTLTPEQAQAQQTQQLTFDDAVRMALDQNYLLKRSANTVRLQESTVSSERASFYPNLNFSTNTSRNFGFGFDQTTGNTFNEKSDRLSLGFNAGVNLFNGFADVASLKQARLNLAASDLDYDRQRQTVVFSVMSQYLNLIQQREEITIQEENLGAQQQLLTQIEEFVRVGSRPMSDLFQQQAAAANAELILLNAQRADQLAEINLIQTLQLDPFGSYAFVVPDVDDILLTPEQYDVNTLLRNAFDRRLDLRAQESAIEATSEGIRVARSSMLPSVSMSGSVGSGYSSLQSQLVRDENGLPVLVDPNDPQSGVLREDTPFGTQIDNNRSQTVGLNFQVPIFNRRFSKTQTQRARVQYDNARLDLENLQQDIGLQVRQAYLDYLTDEKRLDVTDKQLQSAQRALEAEQERYNVGASTLVELTQARASFVQASSDRAEAKYTFLFRKRLIEYYIGVLDPAQPLFE